MTQNLQLNILLKAQDKATKPFLKILKGSEGLRKTLAANESQLRKINGYQRLRDELSKTEGDISAAKGQLKFLNTIQERGGKLTKDQAKQYKALTVSLSKLQSKRKSYITTIRAEATAIKAAGYSVAALGKAQSELAHKVDHGTRALDRQTKRAEAFRRTVKRAKDAQNQFKKSMAAGANMSFVGGAGVLAGRGIYERLSRLTSSGINFEAQMSKAGALIGIDKTSAGFSKLQSMAEKLGKTTAFTAVEAAQGIQELAKAGFNAEKVLKTLPGVLSLAKAGDSDLGETAFLSSNVLTAFKLEADQMGRVGDVLASTFTGSNTTLQTLGETMKYVAPSAQKAGASIEQVSAMAAILGNVGIDASMAGTTLRSTFANIASHAPAISALENLGIQRVDENGNLRQMPDILKEISKATENLGNAEQLEIFKEIAGKNAFAGFGELVNAAGSGTLNSFLDRLANSTGTADRIAKEMLDNVQGDLTIMQSAWEGLNVAIMKSNGSGLRQFVQYITEVVGKITTWVKLNPELTGQLLKSAAILAGLLTAFGGLLVVLAPILVALKSFGIILGGVWAVIKGIAFVVALAVGGSVAAIAGLVAAFVAAGIAIFYFWDEIKSFFVGFWEVIQTIWGGMMKMINAASSITSIFGGMWSAVTGDDPVMAQSRERFQRNVAPPINPRRGHVTTDNSQVIINQTVNGGNPHEVKQAAIEAIEENERNKRRFGRGAFAAG